MCSHHKMSGCVKIVLSLLLLLTCTVHVSIGAEDTWTVSFNALNLDESYTLTKNTDSPIVGTVVVSSNVHTANLGAISWFSPPVDATVNQIPSTLSGVVANITKDALPGSVTYKNVSNGNYHIFQAWYSTSPSFFTIFGQGANGGSVFRCDSMTNGFVSFKCTFEEYNTFATLQQDFSYTFHPGVAKQVATVVIRSSATFPESVVRDPMLAVAFSHMKSVAQNSMDSGSVISDNSDRRTTNQGIVGVLWWFWVTMMVCQIILTSVQQTWLWRLLPTRSDFFVTAFWCLTLSVLLVIVMVTTGIFGWITMGVIYGVYSIVLALVYGCVRCRANRKSNRIDDVELQTRSGHVNPVEHAAIRMEGFTTIPEKMGKGQVKILLVTGVVYLVFAVFFFIVFFGAWNVPQYRLYNRLTPGVEEEFAPQNVAKGSQSVYAWRRFASKLKLDGFFEWATDYCGRLYTEKLSASEKEVRIYQEFILKYDIDMTIFEKESYLQYETVNEWFIRELKKPIESVRPLAQRNDTSVMVSPADARLVAFQNVPPDQVVWIKGEDFTINELVGGGASVSYASMLIVRLAPQDYHRFHSPVAGTITKQYGLSGSLHSVSADAMTSENYAIFNKRVVTVINSADFGDVYFVAIGAVCVGSIEMTRGENAVIAKGEELGYFQFGGSTVAVVIPHSGAVPRVRFDSDLITRSGVSVETYAQMGNQIGVKYVI